MESFFSNFGKVFSIEVIYYLTKKYFFPQNQEKNISDITEKAFDITINNFPQLRKTIFCNYGKVDDIPLHSSSEWVRILIHQIWQKKRGETQV